MLMSSNRAVKIKGENRIRIQLVNFSESMSLAVASRKGKTNGTCALAANSIRTVKAPTPALAAVANASSCSK